MKNPVVIRTPEMDRALAAYRLARIALIGASQRPGQFLEEEKPSHAGETKETPRHERATDAHDVKDDADALSFWRAGREDFHGWASVGARTKSFAVSPGSAMHNCLTKLSEGSWLHVSTREIVVLETLTRSAKFSMLSFAAIRAVRRGCSIRNWLHQTQRCVKRNLAFAANALCDVQT